MSYETEEVRRTMLALGQPYDDLEKADERWTTDQVREMFEVHSFLAPFVFVTRKSDGKKGTLEFTHAPRWYPDCNLMVVVPTRLRVLTSGVLYEMDNFHPDEQE